MTGETPPDFPPGAFHRVDESDDAQFYGPARLVTHIDDAAIAALGEFYGSVLKPGDAVFDLMSSWVSHLPDDVVLGEVTGHGMNEEELRANPRLDHWFVQDLNREPLLPLDDAGFDAALCCVSVQYLTRPVDVFTQVRRVLRPSGQFIVTYSNRCFPTKAVAIWRSLDLRSHAGLVKQYLEQSGFREIEVEVLANGLDSDPLIALSGRA